MVSFYSIEPELFYFLIELGIHFEQIWIKTQSVLLPMKKINEHILDDADLAGPLVYCFVFGMCLLLVRCTWYQGCTKAVYFMCSLPKCTLDTFMDLVPFRVCQCICWWIYCHRNARLIFIGSVPFSATVSYQSSLWPLWISFCPSKILDSWGL